MFHEICEWIEDLALGPPWVIDENMFCGFLPLKEKTGADAPTRCLIVLQNAPAAVDGLQRDMADKPIQLWNRADGYYTAEADAKELYASLHGYHNVELQIGAGTKYLAMNIEAYGTPVPIENPGARGFVFSTNYLFRIEEPG